MSRPRYIWLLSALTLLALAVRLHKLTYHSLWFDEAMSVHWARSSVSRILEVSMDLVEDRLPPLYYLILHYWRLLVGDGELAVRLPSVLLGTLLIPVVYRLGTDLFDGLYRPIDGLYRPFGRRVGSLAAALAALNPFLVWYSQEARMYALAVLLATLGTWFFLRATTYALSQKRDKGAIRNASAPYWLAYGLCAVGGLYTHLYAGSVLLAHALYLLVTYRRSRRAWLPFTLVTLAVTALFAPLALATWRVSNEAGPGEPLADLWTRAWWLLNAFTVWKAPLSPLLSTGITTVIAGFAAAGLLAPFHLTLQPPAQGTQHPTSRHHHPAINPRPGDLKPLHPTLFVGLLLTTPFAIATLLLFRNRGAFFGERYFIIAVPWLLIATAAGTIHLASRLRAISCPSPQQLLAIRSLPTPYSLLLAFCYLLPLTLSLIPLPGQWTPAARKEAWRETVGYLATHARPEDAILIHPDWTRFPLQYYFRGPGQTYAVFGSVDEFTDLEGPLSAISNAHPVVWLVESHTELADPEHRANSWLAARYPQVTVLYPPGLVAMRAYAPGYLSDQLPDYVASVSVSFEGGLKLAGYTLPETQIRATDDLFHPPSGWAHITLYWTTESSPTQNYTPFVNLIDNLGQVWGASLERSNDAFDFYPPVRWEPGQIIRADFDVNLNPVTPPGPYTLVVGLEDASGVQVPLADGSPQIPLTAIEIAR